MGHLDESFKEALQKSKYWTLRGCEMQGFSLVDRTILLFIQNIAGTATDPDDEYFKNPEAMFEALDLIWKILEDARKGGFTVEKRSDLTERVHTWTIHKIEKVKIEPVCVLEEKVNDWR